MKRKPLFFAAAEIEECDGVESGTITAIYELGK
nr:MAG TPA: hypothetical protein [Caudoviricetes sp.]